jgi:hypothetical protein
MSYLKKYGECPTCHQEILPPRDGRELYELHDPAIETYFNDLQKKMMDDSLRMMEEQARLLDTAARAMVEASTEPGCVPVRADQLRLLEHQAKPIDWLPEPGHDVSVNDVGVLFELQDPYNYRRAWVFRVVSRTAEGRPASVGVSLSLSWKPGAPHPKDPNAS